MERGVFAKSEVQVNNKKFFLGRQTVLPNLKNKLSIKFPFSGGGGGAKRPSQKLSTSVVTKVSLINPGLLLRI